jgi:hypothetical protein
MKLNYKENKLINVDDSSVSILVEYESIRGHKCETALRNNSRVSAMGFCMLAHLEDTSDGSAH